MAARIRFGAFVIVAAVLLVMTLEAVMGLHPRDAMTYLAAGERLNAGHSLYGPLLPGDRPVAYGTPDVPAPLLSPPSIAVLWRPLALLGPGAELLWTGAAFLAFFGTLIALGIRAPGITAVVLAALAIPVTTQAVGGNVNAFVLVVAVATWRWHRTYPRLVGAGLAALIVLKLLPLMLLVWLVGQRSWRAAGWTVGVGAVLAVVTVLGAGWDSIPAYLALHPAAAGLVAAVGLSTWVPYAIAAVLVMASLVTAARPSVSFILAATAMVLGTPVTGLHTLALMLAVLAPLAWPRRPHPVTTPHELEPGDRRTLGRARRLGSAGWLASRRLGDRRG